MKTRINTSVYLLGFLSLALAMGSVGCSVLPGAAPAPTEINIGAVVPLTGRYAAGGDQVNNGYLLAVDDINKAGGVDFGGAKVPLKLTVLDDESDPTKTVQRMETLFNDNKVVTYLGGFGSDLHAAAAAIAEKNKTPYLGVAFALHSIHQKGFKYLFSPFPKSPDLARTTFDLFDSLNPKPLKVAIFSEKTDWGAELTGLWKSEIQKRNYQLVTDEQYAPGATDHSAMILKAKAAGAQAVLALPSPPDGIAITKQMKELGFNASVYVFIRASDALSWPQTLGKDGDFFVLEPGGNPEAKFPGNAEMVARHQAKFNKPAQGVTGSAYATIQIIANAVARAKSLDRDKLRDAIAATDLTTVIGQVKFNPDGTGQVVTVVSQYQNGVQRLIWPRDQAAVQLVYPAPEWSKR